MSVPSTFQPLKKGNLDQKLNSTRKPVVLYFMEPSSNLCQLLDPEIDKIAGRLTGTFEFYSINIDDQKDLSYELQIMRCPAFIIYREGEEIRRLTDVNYSEEFEDRFQDFLLGDFHFDYSQFQLLDTMNYSSRIGSGFQMDIVTFLTPAATNNWNLIPVLKSLHQKHQSKALFSLVNAYNNQDILDHFKVDNTPSVLAFHEENISRRWDPVKDAREFAKECDELIE